MSRPKDRIEQPFDPDATEEPCPLHPHIKMRWGHGWRTAKNKGHFLAGNAYCPVCYKIKKIAKKLEKSELAKT